MLGAIPSERFQLAADRHGLGPVLSTEALGGTCGHNAAFNTERGAWVLRGAVLPLEPAMLRRERFFARIIHERSSLASPWPYLVDESDAIFGWPYGIMRRLPGKVLHFVMKVRWSAVGCALGRAIADLHRITLPHIGNWDAACDEIVPPRLAPPEWFTSRVHDLLIRAELDDRSDALVEDLLKDAVSAIGDFEPAYVHGDTGIGNFVGERTSEGFSFSGVFDLARAVQGKWLRMSENDPLRGVLQEWKVPEPSTTLDESVRAGFRAAQPQSAWAQFWSARISVPLPALTCAAAMVLVAAGAWLIAFRSSSPAPVQRPGVVTRIEATGFLPVPDGSALVKEVNQ